MKITVFSFAFSMFVHGTLVHAMTPDISAADAAASVPQMDTAITKPFFELFKEEGYRKFVAANPIGKVKAKLLIASPSFSKSGKRILSSDDLLRDFYAETTNTMYNQMQTLSLLRNAGMDTGDL